MTSSQDDAILICSMSFGRLLHFCRKLQAKKSRKKYNTMLKNTTKTLNRRLKTMKILKSTKIIEEEDEDIEDYDRGRNKVFWRPGQGVGLAPLPTTLPKY